MKRSLVLLLVAALLLAACGGGSDPTPAPAATVAPTEVATEAATEAAAPAPGSAQEAIAQVLDVALHDIYFGASPDNLTAPPEWTVAAGSDVTVNLTNEGALEHDWAVIQPGAEIPVPFLEANRDLLLVEAGLLGPGKTAEFNFTAPTEPGVYTVICTVAGHYPVMQGRLVVQ